MGRSDAIEVPKILSRLGRNEVSSKRAIDQMRSRCIPRVVNYTFSDNIQQEMGELA